MVTQGLRTTFCFLLLKEIAACFQSKAVCHGVIIPVVDVCSLIFVFVQHQHGQMCSQITIFYFIKWLKLAMIQYMWYNSEFWISWVLFYITIFFFTSLNRDIKKEKKIWEYVLCTPWISSLTQSDEVYCWSTAYFKILYCLPQSTYWWMRQ